MFSFSLLGSGPQSQLVSHGFRFLSPVYDNGISQVIGGSDLDPLSIQVGGLLHVMVIRNKKVHRNFASKNGQRFQATSFMKSQAPANNNCTRFERTQIYGNSRLHCSFSTLRNCKNNGFMKKERLFCGRWRSADNASPSLPARVRKKRTLRIR